MRKRKRIIRRVKFTQTKRRNTWLYQYLYYTRTFFSQLCLVSGTNSLRFGPGSTNRFDSDPEYTFTSRLFLSVCLEHVCTSLYIFNGNVPRIITTFERKPRDVNFLSIYATRISYCMLIFTSFFCILCCGPSTSKATSFVKHRIRIRHAK